MKTKFVFVLLACMALIVPLQAQQEPATEAGEDFDLYAAIALFEKAEDLEDYEKQLNTESNDVNNLDLNQDGEVDLVRIVELSEGNTKVLVIQAVIGDDDYQDIATIELEKFADDQISCQIIGDEEIYGPDFIIEPAEETASLYIHNYAVFVSVHLWRPVRVIFAPGRVIFVSVITWRVRPVWFRPWRPIPRATWRGRVGRWHSPRFTVSRNRHSPRGKTMYAGKRRSSPKARNNFGPSPQQQKKQVNKQQQQKQQQQKKQQNKKQQNKKQQQKKQQQKKKQPMLY